MTLTITPFLPFELGESILAKKAVENYKKYDSTDEYPYLQECFANLAFVEIQSPEKKIIAAKASDALARVTIDRYSNIYNKSFIANSANSALMNARLNNQYWKNEFSSLVAKIMEEGMDPLQASEAGLAIVSKENVKKAGMVFIPDTI